MEPPFELGVDLWSIGFDSQGVLPEYDFLLGTTSYSTTIRHTDDAGLVAGASLKCDITNGQRAGIVRGGIQTPHNTTHGYFYFTALPTADFELIWLKAQIGDFGKAWGVVYRPSTGKVHGFTRDNAGFNFGTAADITLQTDTWYRITCHTDGTTYGSGFPKIQAKAFVAPASSEVDAEGGFSAFNANELSALASQWFYCAYNAAPNAGTFTMYMDDIVLQWGGSGYPLPSPCFGPTKTIIMTAVSDDHQDNPSDFTDSNAASPPSPNFFGFLNDDPPSASDTTYFYDEGADASGDNVVVLIKGSPSPKMLWGYSMNGWVGHQLASAPPPLESALMNNSTACAATPHFGHGWPGHGCKHDAALAFEGNGGASGFLFDMFGREGVDPDSETKLEFTHGFNGSADNNPIIRYHSVYYQLSYYPGDVIPAGSGDPRERQRPRIPRATWKDHPFRLRAGHGRYAAS